MTYANSLRKAAATGTFSVIEDAVDAVIAARDPALWAHLIEGCHFDPNALVSYGPPCGEIVPGKAFMALRSRDQRWLDHALRVLLARAPDAYTDAVALRDSVTSLSVRTPEATPGLPIDLSPLESFTKLERLLVRCVKNLVHPESCAKIPSLTHLQLVDTPLVDLSPIAGAPRLERLELDWLDGLPDLRALSAMREVRLGVLGTLSSLDGLASAPLTSLVIEHIEHPDAITDLAALGGLTSLRRLTLGGLSSLRDASALATLTNLEELGLSGASSLTDIAPLASLARLRALDLRGTAALTDPTGLGALASLRALLLHGSGITLKSLPAARREAATASKDATLAERLREDDLQRARAARPAALDPTTHPLWAKLSTLLFAKDHALIDQGVELMASLDDSALFDAVLSDVRWVSPAPRPGRRPELGGAHAALVPGRLTQLPHTHAALRDRALLGLLAAAPEGSLVAKALRDEPTAVDMDGVVDYAPALPLDLRPLAALPHLEHLNLSRAPSAQGLASLTSLRSLRATEVTLPALGAHPHLERLELDGVGATDLSSLPALPALTSLSLARFNAELPLITGFSRLETVSVSAPQGATALAFSELPALREVTLGYVYNVKSVTLRDCPALERLAVQNMGALRLTLEALPSLRRLELSAMVVGIGLDVEGLESLRALESLVISGPSFDVKGALDRIRAPLGALAIHHWIPADLHAVARLTTLRSLSLSECGLFSVHPLAGCTQLESLDLRGNRGLTDPRPLEAMPALRELKIGRSGIRRAKLSPRLQAVVKD